MSRESWSRARFMLLAPVVAPTVSIKVDRSRQQVKTTGSELQFLAELANVEWHQTEEFSKNLQDIWIFRTAAHLWMPVQIVIELILIAALFLGEMVTSHLGLVAALRIVDALLLGVFLVSTFAECVKIPKVAPVARFLIERVATIGVFVFSMTTAVLACFFALIFAHGRNWGILSLGLAIALSLLIITRVSFAGTEVTRSSGSEAARGRRRLARIRVFVWMHAFSLLGAGSLAVVAVLKGLQRAGYQTKVDSNSLLASEWAPVSVLVMAPIVSLLTAAALRPRRALGEVAAASDELMLLLTAGPVPPSTSSIAASMLRLDRSLSAYLDTSWSLIAAPLETRPYRKFLMATIEWVCQNDLAAEAGVDTSSMNVSPDVSKFPTLVTSIYGEGKDVPVPLEWEAFARQGIVRSMLIWELVRLRTMSLRSGDLIK